MLAWPLALAAVRLWALLRVQASWRRLVGPSWELLAPALGLALALVAGTRWTIEAPASVADAIVVLGLEFLLGSVLGLLASLPGWALCGAAEVAESELAGVGRVRTLAALLIALALTAGLALGLHRPLLASLLASFASLPLGEPLVWSSAVADMAGRLPELLADFGALALALATPVLLVRVVVDVGLVALGRGPDPAAALLHASGPGLRFAAAAVALAASWSAHPQGWARALG